MADREPRETSRRRGLVAIGAMVAVIVAVAIVAGVAAHSGGGASTHVRRPSSAATPNKP